MKTKALTVAILGAAAGLRRDEARARDPARLHFVATDFQRLERAFDRFLADAAMAAEAFAQSHDAGKSVHDAQHFAVASARPALGPGDQQTAIIGAKIERGIDVALVAIAMRGRG